ncbi:S-layer homology domain-containing protein [Cyanobacteria bacterium FACHB-472]|nr:S-layer homology domain-containing protein [Cyanobacteria bacterium FACHB-472]
MTNPPPPDPRSSQLGFDELIGIVVAFAAIGAIFFWVIGRKDEGLNLTGVPIPNATASPTPAAPLPPVLPQESPRPQAIDPSTPEASENLTPVVPIPVDPTAASRTIPLAPPPVVVAPAPAVVAPSPTASATPSPTPTASPPARALNFTDIPANYWARPYIQAMAQRNIVAGFTDRTFRPDRPITRAEFAAILQKAFNKQSAQNAPNFKDVPSGLWANAAIKQAATTGFLKGYPNNIFLPNQEIPKAQVFVALASGLGLAPPANVAQVLQTYQDAPQIPNYAKPGVAAATASSLVVNYPKPNLLKPTQAATRAEVAAAIYQALAQAGRVEKIPSQYQVQVQPKE